MGANSGANSLSNLLEISSGPTALLVANLERSYNTSFFETGMSLWITFGRVFTGTEGLK